jgi:hypothetical protein
LISLGPISSQPLAFVGSSDDRASKTSVSVNVKVQMQDEGMGRVLKCGREKELSVKTEWKKVLKSCAFPTSEVALQLSSDTVIGLAFVILGQYLVV